MQRNKARVRPSTRYLLFLLRLPSNPPLFLLRNLREGRHRVEEEAQGLLRGTLSKRLSGDLCYLSSSCLAAATSHSLRGAAHGVFLHPKPQLIPEDSTSSYPPASEELRGGLPLARFRLLADGEGGGGAGNRKKTDGGNIGSRLDRLKMVGSGGNLRCRWAAVSPGREGCVTILSRLKDAWFLGQHRRKESSSNSLSSYYPITCHTRPAHHPTVSPRA